MSCKYNYNSNKVENDYVVSVKCPHSLITHNIYSIIDFINACISYITGHADYLNYGNNTTNTQIYTTKI